MTSVDPAERAKFARDHAYWWDPDGPLWSLHRFNPARVSFLSHHLGGSLAGLRVLDVGCGGGILSLSVARLGARVTGIDISAEAVLAATTEEARQRFGSGGAEFHCSTLEDWAAQCVTQRDRYDIVMLSEVIEHVTDYSAFLSSAAKCVKRPEGNSEGGALLVTTINRNSLSKFAMITAGENFLKILPKGTHSYERFVKPQEVTRALGQAQMGVVASCGFVPVPHVLPRPRLSFSWVSGLTAVNYGMLARFGKL